MARTREEVMADYRAGVAQRMAEATAKGAVVGYSPGVPGARTAAERRQAAEFGEKVSAYTGTAADYRGGSHKIGGVEVVPGAPGYDRAKALPLVKKLIAPYDKSVQSYLKDIGEMDAETEAAIQKVQKEDEYRKSLAQMVTTGELTGPRAEAAMIDYNRGAPNTGIEQRVAEAAKIVQAQEASAAEEEQRKRTEKRTAFNAARKQRMLLANQSMNEPLSPGLQMTRSSPFYS